MTTAKYIFTNVIGTYALDENLNVVEEHLYEDYKEFLKKEEVELEFQKKHNELETLPKDKLQDVLVKFRDPKYFKNFYDKNVGLTKLGIRKSVNEDWMIIQAISSLNEIDRINNIMIKRLREWYGFYFPEFEYRFSNNEKFLEIISEKNKEEIKIEFSISGEDMGGELEDFHVDEMRILAKNILLNFETRRAHEKYLEKIMKDYCPNMLELVGANIAGRLIELGRSLRRLAMLPASTIQLFGAEKALFRHLKTGSLSPKYGVIINHPIVQKAAKADKGKAARKLADKISLSARLDFFKGEFKAADYRKALEEEFIK